jgi:chorismate dehydratase
VRAGLNNGEIMALKVGRVSELNLEPFYLDMPRRGIELADMKVQDLAHAIERQEIDAGPLSLVDAFRLEDRLKPVSGFCVAAVGSAVNSLLFSEIPILELSNAPIVAVDVDSTSDRLLDVILRVRYDIQPGPRVSPDEPHQAVLITGDPALRRRRGMRGYPHRYDLGWEWNQWTGLPFVFCRWMSRNDLEESDAALLEDTLYVGLEDGIDSLYHVTEPRDRLLMLPKDIAQYVQGLRFYIGRSENQAVNLFRGYLDQIGADHK